MASSTPVCWIPWHHVQRLEELNKYPDFNNFLVYVLTKLKTEGEVQIMWQDHLEANMTLLL